MIINSDYGVIFIVTTRNMTGVMEMSNFSSETVRRLNQEKKILLEIDSMDVFQLKSKMRNYNVDLTQNSDTDSVRLQLKKAILEEILKIEVGENNVYRAMLSQVVDTLNLNAGKGYGCFYLGCRYEGSRHKEYIRHVKLCHPRASNVVCKFKNQCARQFADIQSLLVHLKCDHTNNAKLSVGGLSAKRHNVLSVPCKCNLMSCGARHFPNIKDLITHINTFHRNEHRKCIFLNCKKVFPPLYNSQQHFRQVHGKEGSVQELKEVHMVAPACQFVLGLVNDASETLVDDVLGADEVYDDESDIDGLENVILSEDEAEYFLHYYADFLNRLAHFKFIPHSTVQDISMELLASSTRSLKLTETRLRNSLKRISNIDERDVERVIKEVIEDDCYVKAQLQLDSEYKRNKFVQENMKYVAPKEIVLNRDEIKSGESKDVVHYVPIADSVINLMQDKSYVQMILQNKKSNVKKHFVSDITDGSLFQQNIFFQTNRSAIPLLLYSDGVEIVNPLGAARGTYKIVQVFFTLLNIPKDQRSQIDRIQLVMVFREKLLKKYNAALIFKPLIDDLKKLEEGIIIKLPHPKIVQFGLLLYCADNLEAHLVGGFSCSFSSKSICRFCHCQYSDLGCKIHDAETDTPHSRWSAYEYDQIVSRLLEEGMLSGNELEQSDLSSNESEIVSFDTDKENFDGDIEECNETWGVKTVCPFNVLQAFHCVNGLPPDILHDLMEGVIPEDLLIIIRALAQKGWLSIESYNKTLHRFKWSSYEASDKPQFVPKDGKVKKLKGKAVSMWTHIRNWPLLIEKYVQDRNEPFLLMGLKLHEITERLTAHEYFEYEVSLVEDSVVEYLNLRRSLEKDFPNLVSRPKPKHHFIR